MNIDSAAQTIWDYMKMNQKLQKSDLILVLGNRDLRVAEYAAELYKEGWAPLILFSGSGSSHNHRPGRELFVNSTEADVFAAVAMKKGVPKESIIIENNAQNTGQNYEFALKELERRGIEINRIILVQKPYMERRTYATGKIWLPNTELIVTSPNISFNDYVLSSNSKSYLISSIVGDLQRIKEYPKKGFQIAQEIPVEVWNAYEFIVSQGFTEKLIQE